VMGPSTGLAVPPCAHSRSRFDTLCTLSPALQHSVQATTSPVRQRARPCTAQNARAIGGPGHAPRSSKYPYVSTRVFPAQTLPLNEEHSPGRQTRTQLAGSRFHHTVVSPTSCQSMHHHYTLSCVAHPLLSSAPTVTHNHNHTQCKQHAPNRSHNRRQPTAPSKAPRTQVGIDTIPQTHTNTLWPNTHNTLRHAAGSLPGLSSDSAFSLTNWVNHTP
jgi:hypothetical protein